MSWKGHWAVALTPAKGGHRAGRVGRRNAAITPRYAPVSLRSLRVSCPRRMSVLVLRRRSTGVPRNCSPPVSTCCGLDRKSTRLNSSHVSISYAVFCLYKDKDEELMLNHGL